MDVCLNYSGISSWVIYAYACLALLGCDSENSRQSKKLVRVVTSKELIQFNQQKLIAQEALLDSLSEQWGWKDESSFMKLGSGLRVLLKESVGLEHAEFSKDDSARWIAEMRLVDSTEVMTWGHDEPLVFHKNRSGWPLGFQDLANQLSPGDSVECLMPSHMAWGLTGLPPAIPQDAALWLRIRVLPVLHAISDSSNVSNWLQVISDFEQGLLIADPEWCEIPKLLGSSCLAWGDLATQESPFEIEAGTPVSIRMRTQTRGAKPDSKDLGWRTWQYEWGDEGQCLPLIDELMKSDLRFKRWECWCPSERVFGAKGFPEAGILPGEVVGFQWEVFEPQRTQAL